MNTKTAFKEYIAPLDIHGLNGRILKMPGEKKDKKQQREILFIYGTHSSLERVAGMSEDLAQYGNLTAPDLPGFGGMDSFYKIGKTPSLENYAEYLALFIKEHFGDKQISLVGFSLGWAIITKTLQLYPDLSKQINLLVCYGGFSHHSEFIIPKARLRTYRLLSKLGSKRPIAFIFRHTLLSGIVLRNVYARTYFAKAKFKDMDRKKKKEMVEFEIVLWHINDVATWAHTVNTMLNIDLLGKTVDLKVWQVALNGDQYFDGNKVRENLLGIYKQVKTIKALTKSHAPTVIANAEEAAAMLPEEIRNELKKDVKV